MTDPTAKGYTAPRCSCCGYTEEDAKMHMDHHLCRDAGNAPWEVRQGSKLPAKAAPESEDEAFREYFEDTPHAFMSDCRHIYMREAFKAGYARARLDAERGR